jgi:ribosome maturation factor RimP
VAAKGAGSEIVTAIARRVVESHGYELVDVEVQHGRDGQLLRLFVDKTGGIGLEELQTVSHEVSAILDAEDPIDSTYTLEVSSPGLDRPLHSEADYRRFIGKLAKVSSYELVDGRRHWLGRLASVEDGIVVLSLEKEGGTLVSVPFAKIAHGRLEVEFGAGA